MTNASYEGLQYRLLNHITAGLIPTMTKKGNNIAYYSRNRYLDRLPVNIGKLAILIANALNDPYLIGLMDRARPQFEGSDEAKLTMSRTLSLDNEIIFSRTLKDMYLDTEGFHLIEGNGDEIGLPYGAKIGDVLEIAEYMAEKHGAVINGNTPNMALNIVNNAASLEHQLSNTDS